MTTDQSLPDHPGLLPAALLGKPVDALGRPPRRSGRDWFVDVLAFLLALSVGGLLFTASPDRTSVTPALLWVDGIVGLLSCLALWWRRRWPVEIAVVTALFSSFSVLAAVASLVALFTVAVHR